MAAAIDATGQARTPFLAECTASVSRSRVAPLLSPIYIRVGVEGRRRATSAFEIGLLLGALAVSIASARVASAKNRSALLWAIFGFAFGVIPLLIVVFLPRNEDRSRRYATSPATSTYVYATPPAPPRQRRPPRRRPRLPSLRRGPGFASEHISESAAETLQRWTTAGEPPRRD